MNMVEDTAKGVYIFFFALNLNYGFIATYRYTTLDGIAATTLVLPFVISELAMFVNLGLMCALIAGWHVQYRLGCGAARGVVVISTGEINGVQIA